MSHAEPRLRPQQVRQFRDEGWLMVDDIFTPADLQPVRDEITGVIDTAAQRLLAAGKVRSTHAEQPFETRLTRLFAESEEILPPLVGRAGGGHSGPAFFRFITHPHLLDAIECLVGPEIVGSSVYRIRPKMPGYRQGAVPWHQDSGYFSPHCDTELIVTCWIPLVDTGPDNGCLQVLTRAHRQGVMRHYTGGSGGFLVIRDEDLPGQGVAPVIVPVPAGGVLFMTNLTPHRSTQHTRDVIRWAVDVRYQSAAAPSNAGQRPEDFSLDRPDHEIACYAPEADFVVRSRAQPEGVVDSWWAFHRIRQAYEQDHRPPGPQRGWVPLDAAAG